jgi:mono/diheme cytochrome c family protein
MACHNGMAAADGETVSVGVDWRASMMANSSRDPYWQAAVRRETIEHAPATQAIEKECSLCHMPMMNVQTRSSSSPAAVFANLAKGVPTAQALAARDGVSCTVCHQIEATNLGKPESFVGGFVIDTDATSPRKALGPFEIKPALARFMASATTFTPTQAGQVRSSELCATCHTLITEALDENGHVIGRLPEQMPYQEWLASAYSATKPCSACHMPAVASPAPIANLFAEPRAGIARHRFQGGNFIVPTMFKQHATAMSALPQDLEREIAESRAYLEEASARINLSEPQIADGRLEMTVTIENRAGHKLPTAYPSRRVWLHATVSDGDSKTIFESGAVGADGAIAGNDNDASPDRYEPHYQRIERPDQVQIYEAILGDAKGTVTTGLLQAVS